MLQVTSSRATLELSQQITNEVSMLLLIYTYCPSLTDKTKRLWFQSEGRNYLSVSAIVLCVNVNQVKKYPSLHCVSLSAIVNQVQKGIRQCESGKKKVPAIARSKTEKYP